MNKENSMTDVTDDYLKTIALYGLPPDSAADLLPRWAETLLHHRAMLRRVEAVCAQLEARTRDPASVMWGAELRAAITGRKWLYRCPKHGDCSQLVQCHERGVRCGQPLAVWEDRIGGSCCSETAVLAGEVMTP